MRGHGSIQMSSLSPRESRTHTDPRHATWVYQGGMSGSEKYRCLFREVRLCGTQCSSRAYHKCGESKRGRALLVSALFLRTSGRCGCSTLGPLGLGKLEIHNLCDSLQKTRPIRGISSSKGPDPHRGLEGRLLGHSVQTLWDLLGSEVRELVFSGRP